MEGPEEQPVPAVPSPQPSSSPHPPPSRTPSPTPPPFSPILPSSPALDSDAIPPASPPNSNPTPPSSPNSDSEPTPPPSPTSNTDHLPPSSPPPQSGPLPPSSPAQSEKDHISPSLPPPNSDPLPPSPPPQSDPLPPSPPPQSDPLPPSPPPQKDPHLPSLPPPDPDPLPASLPHNSDPPPPQSESLPPPRESSNPPPLSSPSNAATPPATSETLPPSHPSALSETDLVKEDGPLRRPRRSASYKKEEAKPSKDAIPVKKKKGGKGRPSGLAWYGKGKVPDHVLKKFKREKQKPSEVPAWHAKPKLSFQPKHSPLKKKGKGMKKKPPGKPGHTSAALKVCLICLRRYDEPEENKSPELESNSKIVVIDDDEPEIIEIIYDPLSEDAPRNNNRIGSSLRIPPPLVVVESSEKKQTEQQPTTKRADVYVRFLKIVSRYLQIKTKRFRTAAETNTLHPPFCQECFHSVQKFCDVYTEWQHAKIELQWRLNQICDSVKLSKVSGKLGISLHKALSTQLHVFSSKIVDLFRKQLSIKCSTKAKKLMVGPVVSLHKDECAKYAASKLKYPIEHMVGYLKSLIVVFALAVPPVKKEDEKQNGLKSSKSSRVKVKRELADGEKDNSGDDDHSPPGSPVHGDADDAQRGSDTDWSDKNAEASDSDVEFSVGPTFSRRWNLRRRRTRKKGEDENDNGDEDSNLELPLLRRTSVARRVVNEADKKFPCNICNARFITERYLKRHISQAHDFILAYNCTHCPQRFKKKMFLDKHMKKTHPKVKAEGGKGLGKATACKHCQKMFPSKAKMLIHRRQAHKADQGIFTCETCGKKIQHRFRFERHVKSHLNEQEKPFPCTYSDCHRSFSTEEGLKMHSKFHEKHPNGLPSTVARSMLKAFEKSAKATRRHDRFFKCEVPNCDKSFDKESSLAAHKTLHAPSFTCTACEKVFDQFTNFRSHLKDHETDEKSHQCLFCDKGYTLKQTLEFHIKVFHPSSAKIPCDVDICPDEFDTTDELREHLKSAHLPPDTVEVVEKVEDGGIFRFNKEKKTEENSVPANDAAAEKENDGKELALGLFTCEQCRWSFSNRLALSLHFIAHTERGKTGWLDCKLCPKTFKVVDSLQTHYNCEHGPNIKQILCTVCGMRFHRKESYTGHMRAHQRQSDDKNHHCTKCNIDFDDKLSYRNHLKTHRDQSDMGGADSILQCDQCAEIFPNKLKLMKHETAEHGKEKPLRCDAEGCTKSFFTGYALRYHQVLHGQPGFQCAECPKAFHRQTHLEDHILTHSQEMNHICDYCGKTFVKKASLKTHLEIHTGEKNFKCSYCDKAFLRKQVLDAHLRTHTKEKPFPCRICDEKFSQHSARRLHEERHKRLNSDKLVMRPRKDSKEQEAAPNSKVTPAKGKRKRKSKKKVEVAEPTPETAEYAPISTASGIIHEAMIAAFGDGNEMPGELLNSRDEKTLLNSIEVIVQYNENDNNAQGEIVVPTPTKQTKRKGRKQKQEPPPPQSPPPPPKQELKKATDLTCGFCGREFRLERAYNAHVERHLNVDSVLNNSSKRKTAKSQARVTEEVNQHQQSQTNFVTDQEQLTALTRAGTFYEHEPSTSSASQNHVPPMSSEAEPPAKKRRGKQAAATNLRRSSREPPGRRLARIVEDVMEAATNNLNQYNTNRMGQSQTHSPIQQQHSIHSPHQLVHSPSPHSMTQSPSPHQYQAPSPLQTMYSGSERSTPTMSPGPSQTPTYHINQGTNAPAASSAPFLSPFLLPSPYLLQNQGSTQQQQQMTSQQSVMFPVHQQGTNVMSQNQPHPAMTTVHSNYVQQYQHLLHQNSANNTLPQDLSKSSYPMFFANPR